MSVYEGLTDSQQFACRVIADHARSTAFAIADGILPGNEGRNYVLRKIMRRAIYHGREHLGLTDAFFYKVCNFVVSEMNGAYPELETQRDFISKMVRIEEERFGNTLTVGLKKLDELIHEKRAEMDSGLFDFAELAKIYDTYGVPQDLIRVVLEQKGFPFSETEEQFDEHFAQEHKVLQASARLEGSAKLSANLTARKITYLELAEMVGANQFHGYDTTHLTDAKVVAILDGSEPGAIATGLGEGQQGSIVLDQTPFYAEAGGQVGDTGILIGTAKSSPPYEGGVAPASGDGVVLSTSSGQPGVDVSVEIHPTAKAAPLLRKEGSFRATVADTYSPVQGLIIHKVTVDKGAIKVGDTVTATVDAEKRDATRRNHTATHLVHAALREVLGTHVKQGGSVVAPNYLRFDFTHYQPMTDTEIAEVEDLVNREILKNEPVNTNVMPIEQAMAGGAMALFGEKYGADVRVLSIGEGVFSKELCGGTHVRATGDIGSFKIISDEAIASGVRRIRAITGFDAFERFRDDEKLIEASLRALNTQRGNLPNAIARLQEELKKTRREMDELKLKIATGAIGDTSAAGDEPREINGVKVLGKVVEGLDANGTRQLSDTLLARLKSGVVIIGRADEGKVGIIVRVSDDLTGKVKAGDIIREIAPIVGGKGGGKADMAEGGGTEPGKLAEAIDAAYDVVERMLK